MCQNDRKHASIASLTEDMLDLLISLSVSRSALSRWLTCIVLSDTESRDSEHGIL